MVASIKKTKEHKIFGPLLKVNKIRKTKSQNNVRRTVNLSVISSSVLTSRNEKNKRNHYISTLYTVFGFQVQVNSTLIF